MRQSLSLLIAIIYFVGVCPEEAFSQADQSLFREKASLLSFDKALGQLYDFRFPEAQSTISPLRTKFKEHPAILIFDCLTIYWENFPLSNHPAADKIYGEALERSKEKTEVFLKGRPNDPESIFYILFLNVLLARQYAAQDRSTKAAVTALEAYKYIRKGFKLKESFGEFYFSTGLYNYYREFLPDQNKLYKILAWTFQFPDGNKKVGLSYLDKSTYATVFVKPESLLITASIYLKYENDLEKALAYAQQLITAYPGNTLFRIFYIEVLIQQGKFNDAVTELKFLEAGNDKSDYVKLSIALFRGMLAERFYQNATDARNYYLNVITYEPNWDTGNYIGLAFYGLGNIARKNADHVNEKKYYKKANKLCEYLSVRTETDRY